MEIIYESLRPEEHAELLAMATEIWNECYPSIISQAQIDYMLERMYSLERLNEELASGVVWEFVLLNGKRVGFVSYAVSGDRLFLKKIYYFSESRGRGLLPDFLQRAAEYAQSRGVDTLYLTVNRDNARAVSAYRKHGFLVEKEHIAEIGMGYVMDDYIMIRPLA